MNQKIIMKRQILIGIAILGTIIGLSSCEKYSYNLPKLSLTDTIHFATDIQPIFNADCIECHGAIRSPDLREGKSYDALTKGGFITQPGETSKLYLQMNKSDHLARSTDVEKQKVLVWINQGALNN